MSVRPLIGITRPLKGGLIQNVAIRFAVWSAGGKPLTITPGGFSRSMALDGLVVAGGTDVHPDLYKGSDIKEFYVYDEARDQMESVLIREGLDKNLPMLCICRGAQLLNVILGGNLHSDISKAYENATYPNSLIAKIFFRKKILLSRGTKFQEIFKKSDMMVNSMHTQAVDRIGDDLKISSQEENGIVQSIEHRNKNFTMGVQFHPEFLITRSNIRALFKTLIKKALDFREGISEEEKK